MKKISHKFLCHSCDVTFMYAACSVGSTGLNGAMSNLASISIKKDAIYMANADKEDDSDNSDACDLMVIIACTVTGLSVVLLVAVTVVLWRRKEREMLERYAGGHTGAGDSPGEKCTLTAV